MCGRKEPLRALRQEAARAQRRLVGGNGGRVGAPTVGSLQLAHTQVRSRPSHQRTTSSHTHTHTHTRTACHLVSPPALCVIRAGRECKVKAQQRGPVHGWSLQHVTYQQPGLSIAQIVCLHMDIRGGRNCSWPRGERSERTAALPGGSRQSRPRCLLALPAGGTPVLIDQGLVRSATNMTSCGHNAAPTHSCQKYHGT